MNTIETVEAATSANRLLSVGRAWNNDRQNEAGKSPVMTIRIDNNLGINIVIGANSKILLFNNEQKRTGINPATQEEYRDAEYRVAIELPADVVSREIDRQQAAAAAKQAEAVVAPEDTQEAPLAEENGQPVPTSAPAAA